MVKTTLELRDDIYRKMAKVSVEKYGNSKSLSRIANEAIEEYIENSEKSNLDIKKRIEIAEKAAGIWKSKESGSEYVRRIRSESEERLKRLGI